MRARSHPLDGLLGLPALPDAADRRAAFRQGLAHLSIEAATEGPAPLDGASPEALLASIAVAQADGLLDDLGWLAAPAAAVALYELAGALPLGPERRELGRRVLAQLHEGTAETFVAVAARMAAGSARVLSGAGVRARVALCIGLPWSADVRAGSLALALASRREHVGDWIGGPSTASLPERRLAARLFERAAREGVRRAQEGDESALRIFRGVAEGDVPRADPFGSAWRRLLADRETLVWRHVAAARGLLAVAVPELGEAIEAGLSPEHTATEWRRAAASLAASVAVRPDEAVARIHELLRSSLLGRDPGIATALLWGVVPAADTEPEGAAAVLDAVVAVAPIVVAETVADLRPDLGPLADRAAAACAQALGATLGGGASDDEGFGALARVLLRDLGPLAERELAAGVRRAELAFVEAGSREAYRFAQQALALAHETVGGLETLPAAATGAVRSHFAEQTLDRLRDLEIAVFETGTLKNLLLLGRRIGEGAAGVAAVDDLDERLWAWLVEREAHAAPAGPTSHLRRLRALLHLIDGESTDFGDDAERRARVRERWTRTCDVLLERRARERGSPVRRALSATVARAFDALVRDGAADAADVVLVAATRMPDPADLDVLAEASMDPETSQLLASYARFARATSPVGTEVVSIDGALDALATLADEIAPDATERTQLLRGSLSRLRRALDALGAAPDLATLAAGTAEAPSALSSLEDALARLGRLLAGARRRLGDAAWSEAAVGQSLLPAAALRTLHAVGGGETSPSEPPPSAAAAGDGSLRAAVAATLERERMRLPEALARLCASILPRLTELPVRASRRPGAGDDGRPPTTARRRAPRALPNWMPSRRMLGGFYVHGSLGSGAAGTVFVVTRAEERHDPRAERFALKVPDYDPAAARSLSEAEFLKMFRDEAGALLALPEHPNLARFVTFDAGARPKPILVMELVEGIRCDALIESASLDTARAIALLDGVLSGLGAMHAGGVGHLDVKPTNVILRGATEPVLVDFGLAGRHVRPGCATGCYGAPEIWGIHTDRGTPATADVYAFGCLAYEVLTGETLFDAPTEVALVSAHLTHDGRPPPVAALGKSGRVAPLADLLAACLRHDPTARATVPTIRAELRHVARALEGCAWPLSA